MRTQDVMLRTMRPLLIASVVAIPAALAASPVAASRPGSPVELKVTDKWDEYVLLNWRATHDRDVLVSYFLEQTRNGQSLGDPRDTGILSGTGDRREDSPSISVYYLTPETDYCFRIWVRRSDGMMAAQPTNWACTRTLPSAPLAPLDVRAHRQRTLDSVSSPAIIEWSTPDQSAHRRITRYEIDRQSPPGTNRPWIADQSIAGPDGQQSAATQLAFRVKSSALPAKGEHAFRVCAVNDGGRACAKPVITIWTELGANERAAQAPQFQPDPGRGIRTMPRAVASAANAAPLAAGSATQSARAASTPIAPPMPAATVGAKPAPPSDPATWTKRAPAAVQTAPASSVISKPSPANVAPAPNTRVVAEAQPPAFAAKPFDPRQVSKPPSVTGISANSLNPQAQPKLSQPEIVSPAPGGQATQGQLRVQVRTPAGNVSGDAEVEFSWQASRPLTANESSVTPAAPSSPIVWKVSMAELERGAIVPASAGPTQSGSWLVKVRAIGGNTPGGWSTLVSFQFVALNKSQALQQAARGGINVDAAALVPQPLPPKTQPPRTRDWNKAPSTFNR